MHNPTIDRATLTRGGALVCCVVALISLGFGASSVAVISTLGAVALLTISLAHQAGITLTGPELDRLRDAELSLSAVDDTHAAASELAEHAVALLGARSAVVIIEGIGDTVRVVAGDASGTDVYGSGSRMRLLDDGTHPCGSIAVSARTNSKAYGPRDERLLDALAERVSATLHQLSLLTDVRDERRTLADVFGSSSDGIFSVGSDLRVRAWNPAMAEITGVEAELAVGEHINASFRPTFEDGTSAMGSTDPGRAQRPSEVLLQIETDDEQRWLTCSYAPLSDGGYVGIARDETERKKIQDDKDGWIAQVSHELRTPLTPIKGFLSTLQRRDDQLTTEDRGKIYEIMLREEQRLENLVDALLRSTQLDRSDLVVERTTLDWARLLEEQANAARRLDPSRTITVSVAAGARSVLGDQPLAASIVSNLLSNAVKYAETGSIEIKASVDADGVVTRIIDHGPGIPRADHDRIFGKFTRLGDHLTRRQQGVGLGLHIVRRGLDHLDGEVWVESTPGGGATFAFRLPAPTPAPRTRRDRTRVEA